VVGGGVVDGDFGMMVCYSLWVFIVCYWWLVFWGDGLLFVVAFGEVFVGGGVSFRGGVNGGLWW